MKIPSLCLSLFMYTSLCAAEVPSPHSSDPSTIPMSRDTRMDWWREARFGMFIHWGAHSTLGRGEWVMNSERIPVRKYAELMGQFNPTQYDADEWVRIAKNAGMKYIIITTKHHDGFALFASKASKWNAVDATPYARDLIRPLADACQREGIRLGFYYSQAQDWMNGGSARNGSTGSPSGKWDPLQERPMDDYVANVAIPQLRELLTNYGQGIPAVLWWDTPDLFTPQHAQQINTLVKALAPEAFMNGRLGGGASGNFGGTEGVVPAASLGGDWETCMTMNDSWGFKEKDQNWKSSKILIQQLSDVVSKGGNYLLNVGPAPSGLIPEPSVIALQEVGKWMKTNSEAIYGTQAGPFPYLLPWGTATRKGNLLYLLVFKWPTDGLVEVPLRAKVTRAWTLAETGKPLDIESRPDRFLVRGPKSAPDAAVSVIAVELNCPAELGTLPPPPRGPVIPQTADGSITFQAVDAAVAGRGAGIARGLIVALGHTDATVTWRANINKPGRFRVELNYGVSGSHSGSTLRLVCGKESVDFVIEPTGGWGMNKTHAIGEVNLLNPGELEFVLSVVKPKEVSSVGNIRRLVLTPIPAKSLP